MKVILQQHVDHLGERGTILDVANGYARNYLLPKGLALAATTGNLRTIENQSKSWEVEEAKDIAAANEIAARLGGLSVSITMKAGQSGTLYGSVTNSDVAEYLQGKGVAIDRRRIVISDPIKTLGSHEVTVKLHPRVAPALRVEVVAEETEAES